MRHWIRFAVKLYPRDWRQRYGSEFDALLEEAPSDWRQLLNVTWGALAMRLRGGTGDRKLPGRLAIGGALIALAASYCLPARYVSSAILQMVPRQIVGQPLPKDVLERQTEERIAQLDEWMHLLPADLELAAKPGLDLYRAQRERGEVEAVAMRVQRDLEIRAAEPLTRSGVALQVSFAYHDREKARAVVREVVAQMLDLNARFDGNIVERWEYAWSRLDVPHGPFPYHATLEVAEPADLPGSLVRRSECLAIGTAAGLLVGILTVWFRRNPRMGVRLAAGALAGCAIGAALPLIPGRHTATAVIRITPPFDPLHFSGALPITPVSEWAQRLKQDVLASDEFWSRLSRSVGHWRDNQTFHVRSLPGYSAASSGSKFELSVSGADDRKVKQALWVFATFIVLQHYNDLRNGDEDLANHVPGTAGTERKELSMLLANERGQTAKIIEAPRLVVTPYRWWMPAGAALLGMLLGLVIGRNPTGGSLGAQILQRGVANEESDPDGLRILRGPRTDYEPCALI